MKIPKETLVPISLTIRLLRPCTTRLRGVGISLGSHAERRKAGVASMWVSGATPGKALWAALVLFVSDVNSASSRGAVPTRSRSGDLV